MLTPYIVLRKPCRHWGARLSLNTRVFQALDTEALCIKEQPPGKDHHVKVSCNSTTGCVVWLEAVLDPMCSVTFDKMGIVLYAQQLIPHRAELLLMQLSVFVLPTECCVCPSFRAAMCYTPQVEQLLQLQSHFKMLARTPYSDNQDYPLHFPFRKVRPGNAENISSRPSLLPCSSPPDGPISKTLKICAKIELCAQIFQLPYIVSDRLVLLILHSIRFMVSCMS